jgi:4-hydroxythreonine-4-phosphate dehydrogenase
VRAALELSREGERILLFGDAAQLHRILIEAGATPWPVIREDESLGDHKVAIVDTGTVDEGAIAQHAPNAMCGVAQLRALEWAMRAVQKGTASALVTAPTSKEAIVLAGTPFIGQTEHLARGANLEDDEVTMLFIGPRLKTALVTTHLAVRDVPAAITIPRVVRATLHLGEALVRLGVAGGAPVAIASLNPHAGENGLFGDEEPRVLGPALEEARRLPPFSTNRLQLVGIVPAETAFRKAADGALQGVVAMMHDQATIASKLLDWGAAVNVTWGLPFVRTSVEHGVAYDAAVKGLGDPASMIAAARLARVFAGSQ